jgi:DNA-binding NtrC family response regulator
MSAVEHQSSVVRSINPKLVYVVDDESMIGDVVQIVLKMGGYEPRFFQNPDAALQALIQAEVRPVLLLTDYVMASMNGMELIRQCKIIHPGLRTILYSGNAGEDVLQQDRARPDAFLRKPFLPSVLLGLVQTTLSGSPDMAPVR